MCVVVRPISDGMHQLLWARLGPLGYCPCNDGLNIGVDLRSAYDMRVPAFGNAIIWTNIALQFPPGTYGRIADRSGMASQNSITVGGGNFFGLLQQCLSIETGFVFPGVIDPGYRGNIGVILFNHGAREYGVKRGDKVCQILCECAVIPTICEVGELAGTTARGESGFGSSGR